MNRFFFLEKKREGENDPIESVINILFVHIYNRQVARSLSQCPNFIFSTQFSHIHM